MKIPKLLTHTGNFSLLHTAPPPTYISIILHSLRVVDLTWNKTNLNKSKFLPVVAKREISPEDLKSFFNTLLRFSLKFLPISFLALNIYIPTFLNTKNTVFQIFLQKEKLHLMYGFMYFSLQTFSSLRSKILG